MAFDAATLFGYAIALLIVAGTVWWVLARWVPDGGATAPYAFSAYQAGLTRRETVPAVIVASLIFVPVVTTWGDVVGLGWALVGGLFIGGVYVGTVALAARPRARFVDDAGGDPDTLTRDGPNVVAGSAAVPDGNAPLVAPVSEQPAVCYVASIAQYQSQPFRNYGSFFITSFDVRTRPFVVDGEFGRADVDPEGAWVSMLSGSPTDVGSDLEDAFTGGPSEHEHVVEAGEVVPERFRDATSVFGTLPLTDDGRTERELRFKETSITLGDDVVVAGEAETGDAFGSTVIRCDVPGGFVAKGSFERVSESLSESTGRNLVIASVATVLGGVGLLWLAIP